MTDRSTSGQSGWHSAIRRAFAIIAFVLTMAVMGAAAFQLIPHPPLQFYIFMLVFTGFVDPTVVSEFLKSRKD